MSKLSLLGVITVVFYMAMADDGVIKNWCPPTWTFFDKTGFCYKNYEAVPVNQPKAEKICVLNGGHLSSVHSKEENDFLGTLSPKDKGSWIGLQTFQNDKPFNDRFKNWTDASATDFTDPAASSAKKSDAGRKKRETDDRKCYKAGKDGKWDNSNACDSKDNVEGFVCKLKAINVNVKDACSAVQTGTPPTGPPTQPTQPATPATPPTTKPTTAPGPGPTTKPTTTGPAPGPPTTTKPPAVGPVNPTTKPVRSVECKAGWRPYFDKVANLTTKCFQFTKSLKEEDKMSRDKWEESCAAAGGHLATVMNADENTVLNAEITTGQKKTRSGPEGLINVWIGLKLKDGATDVSDANWQWADKAPLVFKNFADGQPDIPEEKCVRASVDVSGIPKWYGANCDGEKKYFGVCMISGYDY